jgi:hypothetical protein
MAESPLSSATAPESHDGTGFEPPLNKAQQRVLGFARHPTDDPNTAFAQAPRGVRVDTATDHHRDAGVHHAPNPFVESPIPRRELASITLGGLAEFDDEEPPGDIEPRGDARAEQGDGNLHRRGFEVHHTMIHCTILANARMDRERNATALLSIIQGKHADREARQDHCIAAV